jgi:hypothetical protein
VVCQGSALENSLEARQALSELHYLLFAAKGKKINESETI